MIRHVVLLNWKSGVSQQQVDEVSAAFAELQREIPEIVSYDFGRDAAIYPGNADYALVAEFANQTDLKAYVKPPSHQRLMADVTGPLLKSFQSIQFRDEA